MKNFVIRSVDLKTEEIEGKKYLTGIIPYNARSLDLGGFTEIITPTAFNKTINDKKNVRALLDHKKEKVLGDIKSGTLKLENRNDGLVCTVEVPNTTYAQDAFELMSRGIGNAMSFGFYPVKTTNEPQTRTKYLNEVKLEEVSFLISEDPAYPASNAKTLLRSLEDDVEELNVENIKEEDKQILIKIRDKIDSLIPIKKVEETIEPKKVEVEEVKPSVKDTSVDSLLLEMEIEQLINS